MSEQVIKSFVRLKIVDVLVKGHQIDAARSAAVKGGGALAVGENLRFDVTPVAPDGHEYPGNDPTVNGPKFRKEDGTSPIIEYRWGSGEQEFSNSGDDPFHLNSYEDNGGCTPNLKLTRQIGPGANAVWIYAYVRPEYNGGVSVQSEKLTFNAD